MLLTFDADPLHPAVSLVLRQYKKQRDLTYSISIYSTSNFGIGPAKDAAPRDRLAVQGSWSGAGSGGACGRSRAFYTNPQYRIEVAEDTDMRVVLQASPKLSVSASVSLSEKRLNFVSKDLEAFSSGDYRPAVSTCSGRLKKGNYVCVVSTWNVGETGAYALEFRGAGIGKGTVKICKLKGDDELYKFKSEIKGKWEPENGVGCANHGRYEENETYKFTAASKGELLCRLLVVGEYEGEPISLNVSVFVLEQREAETTQNTQNTQNTRLQIQSGASSIGKNCGLVGSSNGGVYSAGAGGVSVKVGLEEGKSYGVVVSSFEPLQGVKFEFKAFSDCKLNWIK